MPKQKGLNKKTSSASKTTEVITLMFICAAMQTSVFICACIFSLLINVKNDIYFPVAVAALCIGSAFSGFTSVRKIRKNGLLNGILYVLPSNVVYMMISLAMNSFVFDYITLISFTLLVIFSAVGGVISVNFIPKTNNRVKR